MYRFLLPLLLLFTPSEFLRAETGETVILLHGLGRTRWSFYRVERELRADGYNVVNITYPSREKSIEYLTTNYLEPLITAHRSATRLHFVTHSMGGLIMRSFLASHPDDYARLVRKWVALAAPFGGAPGFTMDALLTGVQFAEV